MSTIPGINIRSYSLNEHKLMCKFDIDIGAANEFIRETPSGLPFNRELEEVMLADIRESLDTAIKKLKEKRNGTSN